MINNLIKVKDLQFNGNFLDLFMFGEYSFHALKIKKVLKEIDNEMTTFVGEYIESTKK